MGKLRKVEDTFSDRLKMLRKERGWSQEDLAARLQVSPGSVGNWEIGPHQPHPKTLAKIAAQFEVEVSFLLRGQTEGAHPAALREQPTEYGDLNVAELLREIEGARDCLDRIARQLRKLPAARAGAATGLVEMAAASYDQKRGGSNRA